MHPQQNEHQQNHEHRLPPEVLIRPETIDKAILNGTQAVSKLINLDAYRMRKMAGTMLPEPDGAANDEPQGEVNDIASARKQMNSAYDNPQPVVEHVAVARESQPLVDSDMAQSAREEALRNAMAVQELRQDLPIQNPLFDRAA